MASINKTGIPDWQTEKLIKYKKAESLHQNQPDLSGFTALELAAAVELSIR